MSFQNAKIVGVGCDPVKYHQHGKNPGDPDYPQSPSSLKEILRNPSRWLHGYHPPGSDAMAYGTLLDCRRLTPDQFATRFAVKPATYPDTKTGEPKPWNGNSTWCKQWLEDHEDVEVVSQKEVDDVDAAIKRLAEDETLGQWHQDSDVQVWVSAEWHDEQTGLVIPCRCLIDYVPRPSSEFAKCLGDLKTVTNASVDAFQKQCYRYGWHIQAAMDLDLYRTARPDEDRTTWCFIVQENYEPWEIARHMLSEDFLQIGRLTYIHALELYCRCLKTGKWPGYSDTADSLPGGWTLIQASPWMEFESLERAIEQQQTQLSEDDIIP